MHADSGHGGGGRPDRRGLGRAAGLAGLAVGALCLTAACSTSSTTPPAAGSTPTPAQSTTQPSSPAASSPAGGSTGSAGSSSTVTAAPASSAQVAAFTAAAEGHCGFTSSAYTLTDAKVTSNGWGSATVTARNPAAQGNASMIFQQGSSWTYNTCGSSFDNGAIPQDVLNALGL